MSQEPEAKEGKAKKLSLVINFEGQSITVKVKCDMPFRKVFEAATKRFGKETEAFKFVHNGIRIKPDETPALLDLEDGDLVDAFLEQVGGNMVPILVWS